MMRKVDISIAERNEALRRAGEHVRKYSMNMEEFGKVMLKASKDLKDKVPSIENFLRDAKERNAL